MSHFRPPVPWNAESMPWTATTPYPRVMEFNATTSQIPDQYPNKNAFNYNCYKRKSDVPLPSPSKQFITEEKMAAHLNGLHISPDYVSHNTATAEAATPSTSGISDIAMDADAEFCIPLTAKDLQEKLKNANKITICEEIKKLTEEDGILPKALLGRIEKPCTALVLWQPPPKIKGLIINKSTAMDKSDIGIDDDDNDVADGIDNGGNNGNEDQQNNNSSTLDYNYGMEMFCDE